ncbi:signal peptidase I [Microbulbifer sp. TRSA007]|uniref:signal peptidase I n=1 Tax=Microbulbifer sp. TRSA007 TaxID=3243384 RepID=UPI004039D788
MKTNSHSVIRYTARLIALPLLTAKLIFLAAISNISNNIIGFYSFIILLIIPLLISTPKTIYSSFNYVLKSRKTSKNKLFQHWISLSLLIILLTCTVHFRASLLGFDLYIVKANSMLPTLKSNDVILVDTRKNTIKKIEPGDIILFRAPMRPGTIYIKRVVGLPGERLFVSPNKVEPTSGSKNKYQPTITVNTKNYFVTGDNLKQSRDSRHFGTIKENLIIGKSKFIIINYSSPFKSLFNRFAIPLH